MRYWACFGPDGDDNIVILAVCDSIEAAMLWFTITWEPIGVAEFHTIGDDYPPIEATVVLNEKAKTDIGDRQEPSGFIGEYFLVTMKSQKQTPNGLG